VSFYEDGSHIILKIGVIFIGIPVLPLCIFLVPELADVVTDFIDKNMLTATYLT
jgi:hypothetical protein